MKVAGFLSFWRWRGGCASGLIIIRQQKNNFLLSLGSVFASLAIFILVFFYYVQRSVKSPRRGEAGGSRREEK